MRIACLDAYLPCFGWSLGLVFGGLTYPSKTEAPLRFQVGDGLRCLFFEFDKPKLGEVNWLETTLSRPYQVFEGGEKREVSNREPEGEVNSETVPGCGSGRGHLPLHLC